MEEGTWHYKLPVYKVRRSQDGAFFLHVENPTSSTWKKLDEFPGADGIGRGDGEAQEDAEQEEDEDPDISKVTASFIKVASDEKPIAMAPARQKPPQASHEMQRVTVPGNIFAHCWVLSTLELWKNNPAAYKLLEATFTEHKSQQ
jgi:hypothetical protein